LGGRFISHGAVEQIRVRAAVDTTGPFEGIDDFTITDELYVHEAQPDLRVHVSAAYQGRQVPLVWTRTHGAGRVCYACPGHTTASLQHSAVQELLRRGLKWVCRA
jgi:hypothetical protein